MHRCMYIGFLLQMTDFVPKNTLSVPKKQYNVLYILKTFHYNKVGGAKWNIQLKSEKLLRVR